jgi:membrane protease YdiL (CAAX protease family)
MYLVLAGLIGLYLGGIWLATGNLLVPIIAHAMYDFVALVYFVKTRKKK